MLTAGVGWLLTGSHPSDQFIQMIIQTPSTGLLHPSSNHCRNSLHRNRVLKIFFNGAQVAVNLEEATQIISGISFTTAHIVYVNTNKTKIVWVETELFSFHP